MWDSGRLENLRRMFEAQLRRQLTPEEFRLLSLTEPLNDPKPGATRESELPKVPKKATAS